ncbi:hypothetical protein BC937DRAFT_86273 [Endogone sp. FLAS-F59071]|nr:hypothetical protein BC937DRAFT_86273 [Endogone sp. FLAS-F59071]|eukprot:RUS20151.1 hypothetical protein BC937DRAFT_86273 [Endogone sp. FLAS-F59071]
MGDTPGGDGSFSTLFKTACTLQSSVAAGQPFPDLITATKSLPVVEMPKLYVREAYKKLYDELISNFTDTPTTFGQNCLVVCGTSGIGKSAFLLYLTIRLLAKRPAPIIIFHAKSQLSECYAFGGTSCFRSGNIADFKGLLNLPETWYLVDSVAMPECFIAKTVIAASPNTLETNDYQYVLLLNKRYMAPWSLVELSKCRKEVFPSVPLYLIVDLYAKWGGVPGYLLGSTAISIAQKEDIDHVKKLALGRLKEAIQDIVIGDPDLLLQCVAQNKSYLKLSNYLLHRWPSLNSEDYHLKWASSYVKEQIQGTLKEISWTFVHHLFRHNGGIFTIRKLQDGALTEKEDFMIQPNTTVKFIRCPKELSEDTGTQIPDNAGDQDLEVLLEDLPDVADDDNDKLEDPVGHYRESLETMDEVPQDDNRLVIPNIPNFAAADLSLLPTTLFQVTVSEKHPIKQAALATIIKSMPAYKDPKAKFKLIFVVPDELYDNYPVQKYVTSDKKDSSKVPLVIQKRVEQWVLGIDISNV